MTDHDSAEALNTLANSHRASIDALLVLRRDLADGRNVAFDLAVASHREMRARARLLNWQSPTRELALAKMVSLLSNALLANIPYDEISLQLIRAEAERFQERSKHRKTN